MVMHPNMKMKIKTGCRYLCKTVRDEIIELNVSSLNCFFFCAGFHGMPHKRHLFSFFLHPERFHPQYKNVFVTGEFRMAASFYALSHPVGYHFMHLVASKNQLPTGATQETYLGQHWFVLT